MDWRHFAHAMTRFSRRKRLAQREAERRHRIAEEARQKALGGPPLTEWEVMAGYGAVEAERARASKG